MQMALAEVVKRRLEASGTSLRAASITTGIPLTTLSRRLTGTSPFSVTELVAFASMFEITMSCLAIEAEDLNGLAA